MLPHIKTMLRDFDAEILKSIDSEIDSLSDVCSLIENAIGDEPPIAVREGGMIREGFDADVDRLRHAKTEGRNWLAKLEEEENDSPASVMGFSFKDISENTGI